MYNSGYLVMHILYGRAYPAKLNDRHISLREETKPMRLVLFENGPLEDCVPNMR